MPSPVFTLRRITITARPLPDPNGGVLPEAQYPFVVGSTLNQWADYPLAAAWLEQATTHLNDTANVARLDAAPNLTDRAANLAQATQQFNYVFWLSAKICNVFNALNILWYDDSVTRQITQDFFSGAPADHPGLTDIFNERTTWGGHQWFQPNEQYPLILPGSEAALGTLPRFARDCFTEFYPRKELSRRHPLQFVPRFSFVITPQSNMDRGLPDGNPLYAPTIKNQAFATLGSHPNLYGCPNMMAAPWDQEDVFYNGHCFADWGGPEGGVVVKGKNVMAYDGVPSVPKGTVFPGDFYDWRMCTFDEAFAWAWGTEVDERAKLKVAVPLKAYVAYLAAVLVGLTKRSLDEIVQDARAYSAWTNVQTMEANGGGEVALRKMLTMPSDIATKIAAGDPTLSTIANGMDMPTMASSVGSAIGTVAGPLGTAIGGLLGTVIGGGIQLVINAVNGTLIKGRITGHGRDDLGRYKLIFERATLASPTRDAEQSKPALTNDDLPTPAGFVRPPPSKRDNLALRDSITRSQARVEAARIADFHPPPMGDQVAQQAPSAQAGGSGALLIGGLLLLTAFGVLVFGRRSRNAAQYEYEPEPEPVRAPPVAAPKPVPAALPEPAKPAAPKAAAKPSTEPVRKNPRRRTKRRTRRRKS